MAVEAPDATKLPSLGTNQRLYLANGTDAFPMETESSIAISNALIEISNKDTGNYRTTIDSIKALNCPASVNYSTTNVAMQSLVTKILSADSSVEFVWGDITNVGGLSFHGYARLSNIDISEPNAGVSTMSFTLESTGEFEAVIKTV